MILHVKFQFLTCVLSIFEFAAICLLVEGIWAENRASALQANRLRLYWTKVEKDSQCQHYIFLKARYKYRYKVEPFPKIGTLRGWSCEQRLEYLSWIQMLRNELMRYEKCKNQTKRKIKSVTKGKWSFPPNKGEKIISPLQGGKDHFPLVSEMFRRNICLYKGEKIFSP